MNFLQKTAKSARDFFARHGYVCDCCGKEVFDYPNHRLCEDCEEKLHRNNRLLCDKCGRQTLAQGICLSCKKKLPSFTKGISPFVYRGETAALVNRIKNGKRRLAYFFAEEMANTFKACVEKPLDEPFLVLPVPLTSQGKRLRGYNQAEELALLLCDILIKEGVAVEFDNDVLQKRRENTPQKQLSFTAREKNVEGAYHVHKRSVCKDRRVLLIDDIMTTGATGSECSARLLGAGAKEVIFLVGASLPERK